MKCIFSHRSVPVWGSALAVAGMVTALGTVALAQPSQVAPATQPWGTPPPLAPPPPPPDESVTLAQPYILAQPVPPVPPRSFVYGIGPGAGNVAVGMGARVYFATGEGNFIPIPTYDLNVVYGISDAVDFELRLASLGLLNLLDVGVRARIVGDETASFWVRGDATALVMWLGNVASAGVFGLTPGVGVSLGGHRNQLSIGVDIPIMLAAAVSGSGTSGSGTGVAAFVRPAVTYEFGVTATRGVYIQLQAYVAAVAGGTGFSGFYPDLAVGSEW